MKLKIPPVILMFIVGLLMYISSMYLDAIQLNPIFKCWLLMAILLGAVLFIVLGAFEFRKRSTTVDPRSPNKASALVDSGIYRVSRNPMYVGFALCLLALVIVLQSPWLVAGVGLFVAYMNKFQIAPEEQALTNLFGDSYIEYQNKVPRWL